MATQPASAYLAFTAPVNLPGLPSLSREQIWVGLQSKVRHAEEFVGGAIVSTNVLSETKDIHGREVVTREVILRDGERKLHEVCTLFEPTMIEPDGSRAVNILSDSADGQLYLTYTFEGTMKDDTPIAVQKANIESWKRVSQVAVESTIKSIRNMAADGRL